MIPKLILCDLDGTLLNDEKTITPYTKEIIQKAREQGILFGLATGRSLYAVDSLIDDWGIREQCDVLMGFNGAQIIDSACGVNEINDPLEGETILEIASHFEDLDIDMCIYDENDLWAYYDTDLSKNLAKSNKFTHHVIDDPKQFFTRPFPKLVLITKQGGMDEVVERAGTFSSDDYHGFQTAPILYEYVSPKVSKSNGIRRICELHGITMDDVCTFGDAQNDHDMLRAAGLGVCMINGTDATKALSDDITEKSNNEDGVADYILKNFLK